MASLVVDEHTMGIRGALAKMLLAAILLVAAQFVPSLAHAHGSHAKAQATPVALSAPAIGQGRVDAVEAPSSNVRHVASIAAPSPDDTASSGRCGMPCCNGTGVSCCSGALPSMISSEPCAVHADRLTMTLFGQLPAGIEPNGLQRPPRALTAA